MNPTASVASRVLAAGNPNEGAADARAEKSKSARAEDRAGGGNAPLQRRQPPGDRPSQKEEKEKSKQRRKRRTSGVLQVSARLSWQAGAGKAQAKRRFPKLANAVTVATGILHRLTFSNHSTQRTRGAEKSVFALVTTPSGAKEDTAGKRLSACAPGTCPEPSGVRRSEFYSDASTPTEATAEFFVEGDAAPASLGSEPTQHAADSRLPVTTAESDVTEHVPAQPNYFDSIFAPLDKALPDLSLGNYARLSFISSSSDHWDHETRKIFANRRLPPLPRPASVRVPKRLVGSSRVPNHGEAPTAKQLLANLPSRLDRRHSRRDDAPRNDLQRVSRKPEDRMRIMAELEARIRMIELEVEEVEGGGTAARTIAPVPGHRRKWNASLHDFSSSARGIPPEQGRGGNGSTSSPHSPLSRSIQSLVSLTPTAEAFRHLEPAFPPHTPPSTATSTDSDFGPYTARSEAQVVRTSFSGSMSSIATASIFVSPPTSPDGIPRSTSPPSPMAYRVVGSADRPFFGAAGRPSAATVLNGWDDGCRAGSRDDYAEFADDKDCPAPNTFSTASAPHRRHTRASSDVVHAPRSTSRYYKKVEEDGVVKLTVTPRLVRDFRDVDQERSSASDAGGSSRASRGTFLSVGDEECGRDDSPSPSQADGAGDVFVPRSDHLDERQLPRMRRDHLRSGSQ